MESGKVGAFIAQLRREKGLTQQGLADALGVTNKAVSKWETGDGYPEITMLPILADALGVTADELLRGERAAKKAASAADGNADTRIALEAAWLKFRNMNLVCLGISILGCVAFGLLLIAAVNEWIALGVMIIFLLFSIMLFAMQFNTFNATAARYPAPNSDEGHLRPMAYNRIKASLLIFFWIYPFLTALSANLLIDTYCKTLGGVLYLDFDDYAPLRLLLASLMIAGVISFFAGRAVADKINLFPVQCDHHDLRRR